MTNRQIFNMWKNGEDIAAIPTKDLYRALEVNWMQVFMVTDCHFQKRIWVYIPEDNKMTLVR